MLHWHSPREDLIGVIALIVYVITCGSFSGGRNGSILDSHTIYFLSFGAFNLQESPLRIRGKSTALVFAAPTAEDHPCACGEKSQSQVPVIGAPGSPPRMRGKVPDGHGLAAAGGITPAHAGKSTAKAVCTWTAKDHPRACGEKATRSVFCASFFGITPAHTGKSSPFSSRALR